MSRLPVSLALVGLVAGLPASAAAQSRLSVDDAVREALANNRPLQSSRAAITEADARVREARSGLFPRITIAEAWQRGDQPVFVFSSLLSARRFAASNFAIDALNHPDPIGFFHTTLGVEHLLFDGGRVRAGIRAASLQRDMTRDGVDEAASGVVLAVTQTYGRVLTAQAARQAAESGLAAARDDLDRVEQRRNAGMATEADVLSLRVHVSDLQQRLIQAEGDEAIARAELNRLMGAPVDRDVVVIEPAGVAAGGMPVASLVAQAESARPELRRAATAAALGSTLERQARTALVPQVAAQAAFDVSGTRFSDRASSWILGAEARWTFSIGGAEQARVKAAAAAASRARIDREEARSAVQVDVVSAVRRLESARARQAAGLAAVEQARESQRIVRNRFDAGMAGVTDVLRASTAVLDAEAQRTAALVDTMVSDAMLARAIGRATDAGSDNGSETR